MITCPHSRALHDRLGDKRKKKTRHRQTSMWRSRPAVFSLLPSALGDLVLQCSVFFPLHLLQNHKDDLVRRLWRLVLKNPKQHRQHRCLRIIVHPKKSSKKSPSLIIFGNVYGYLHWHRSRDEKLVEAKGKWHMSGGFWWKSRLPFAWQVLSIWRSVKQCKKIVRQELLE